LVVRLDAVTVVVDDYDEAIEWFTGVLGFEVTQDAPSLTNDGRPKRWVVVRPPGGDTGIVLAQADGAVQKRVVGGQAGGRVALFLMQAANVTFVTATRDEPYGRCAVFLDVAGNRWDLLGPPSTTSSAAPRPPGSS
jgi:catechol 2,3-dioxygenase-like lactoylglutathione lyase family enzyme